MTRIKYLAVLLAGAIYWILGALWYSPLLFGDKYVALMQWTPERIEQMQREGGETTALVTAFVSSIIQAYALSYLIGNSKTRGLATGVATGIIVASGIIIASNLETILFEYKPIGLFLISNGYHLTGYIIMGLIIGWWNNRSVEAS